MAEFVEGDHEHLSRTQISAPAGRWGWRESRGCYLEWPERVFDIRDIPEESNDCHVENDYPQRYPLRVVYGEAAAEDEVLR